MQFILRTALMAAILGLCACGGASEGDELSCNGNGGDNLLEGSYCEDVEMIFTEARVLSLVSGARSFVRIEYVRPLGTGLEKTLMVVFDASAVMIVPGEKFNFLDAGGSVTRILQAGPVGLTGELEGTNTVQLDVWTGELDSPVEGRVDLAFKNGRRLSGEFKATLQDALPSS